MIGQGEFSEDGQPWASARGYPPESRRGGTWSWQHPGLYVYGYNRPLFCQRVHDVLTMIRFVQTDQHTAQKIDLVGVGTMAGPIAAAAKFMAGDAVASAVLEEPKSGMTFASLDRFDHPMFVPGAVRYGDVDALKALAAGDGLPAAERASRWIDRLSP
jgi:hypothetical protein